MPCDGAPSYRDGVADVAARKRKQRKPGPMQTFTLIGRPTLVFRVVRWFTMAGIECVYGVTLDGKLQTTARVVDAHFAL